jgi:hypothetical protein
VLFERVAVRLLTVTDLIAVPAETVLAVFEPQAARTPTTSVAIATTSNDLFTLCLIISFLQIVSSVKPVGLDRSSQVATRADRSRRIRVPSTLAPWRSISIS